MISTKLLDARTEALLSFHLWGRTGRNSLELSLPKFLVLCELIKFVQPFDDDATSIVWELSRDLYRQYANCKK